MSQAEEMLAPADVAARWFARRRLGGLDPLEQEAFDAWIQESAEHQLAYAEVEAAWRGVEDIRNDPRVMAMREQAVRRNAPWRRFLAPASIAAGLLLCVLAGWWAYDAGFIPNRQFHTQSFRTAVGERSTIKLPDGSVVTMNTDTILRTEAAQGRRLVHLERGEAYFQVAKDASRPFIVSAAGRTVTALGTAFEVRVDSGRFEVTLVEGKVRVESPVADAGRAGGAARGAATQATEMAPGTQLVASDDTAWRLEEINAQQETSWLTGQLVFRAQPLAEVVAELNRYSHRQLEIDGQALADIPITGTFRPGDNESFAAAVTAYGMARAEEGPGGSIRLVAPKQPS